MALTKKSKTWLTIAIAVMSPCSIGIADEFAEMVKPFISKHCLECHNSTKSKAEISLAGVDDLSGALKARKTWDKVVEQLENRTMPPEHRPIPSESDYGRVLGVLKSGFIKHDTSGVRDPGRVTIRRLNRAEYNNTIRDLLGVEFRPADDFPSDNLGYGFDNIGDVLSISPLLLEKYLTAAEMIADRAIVEPKTFEPTKQRISGTKLKGEGVVARGARMLATNGETFGNPVLPREGDYLLRVQAFGDQIGREPVKMAVRLDDRPVKTFEVKAIPGRPAVYETKIAATHGGKQKVAFAFLNDLYQPKAADPKQRDRNLYVNFVEITGPLDKRESDLPDSYRRVMIAQPKTPVDRIDTARKIMRHFARRAYRRPVEDREVDRLVAIVAAGLRQGISFEAAIRFGVQAALVSPNFLFRVELHSKPTDAKVVESINDFELASRLSYFLWSSMPDDELFRDADAGKLHDPDVLEKQIRRMLADSKATALTENFAGQWLETRKMTTVTPDPKTFPEFDDALRSAMKRETEMFFESIVKEDRSVLEFIDAKYTFINDRLSKLYGIPFKGKGKGFKRVELDDPNRGGVLTQASFLTLTSNPTRTSPVKRGKWVLEQFLNDPPPPPPPGAGELKDDGKVDLNAPLRKRLEQHRSKADCASCHQKMDPIGFGLENFNGIGVWRKKEGKDPVDNSGTLTTGESFRGPAELKKVLLGKKDQFVRCLAEKLLTYALGRGVESYDKPAVDKIVRKAIEVQYKFSALVVEVVKSDAFLKRRGDGDSK